MATKPVDVFCKCRLTWSRVRNQLNQLGDLIQCDICKKWFHEVCGIVPNVFHFKYIHSIFFTFFNPVCTVSLYFKLYQKASYFKFHGVHIFQDSVPRDQFSRDQLPRDQLVTRSTLIRSTCHEIN